MRNRFWVIILLVIWIGRIFSIIRGNPDSNRFLTVL
jgi:hypothetical protein